MSELSDYQLGHNIVAQNELLLRSYETNDQDAIEGALNRIVMVRRMKKNGTLDWQAPEFDG
jgi:hypothetical protein